MSFVFPKENNYYIIILSLIIITMLAVLTNRCLYADGSAFFDNILFKSGFHVFDKPRIFAQYLTQIPTVFAIDVFHINDKGTLLFIYGSTLYGIPLLGILLTALFIENKKLLWIPLLSFYFASIYSYMFIISEAHIMNSIFWVLIVLLTREQVNYFHKSVILIFLGMASHLYESYIFFSIVLGLIVLYKIKNEKIFSEKLFYTICLMIISYGFYIALYSYLYPRDPANAGGFSKALINIFTETYTIWFMFGVFLITILIKESLQKWLLPLLFIGTFSVLFMHPQYLEIEKSYSGRTLLTVIPFIFSLLYLVMLRNNTVSIALQKINTNILNALGYVAVFFLALQTAITFQWYGYIQIFKTTLEDDYSKSVIHYKDTILGKNAISNQIINKFNWGWTYPFMSYALSGKTIWTIIENKDNHCCMPNPYVLLTKIDSKQPITFSSLNVKFINWQNVEKSHRWSKGNKSSIKFNIINIKDIQGIIKLEIGTLGIQEIKLKINNYYIGSQAVNGDNMNLIFKFDTNILYTNSINTIEFEFPNAHKPDNGDQRVLAMALKSFIIE